jgi:hypothetical protein
MVYKAIKMKRALFIVVIALALFSSCASKIEEQSSSFFKDADVISKLKGPDSAYERRTLERYFRLIGEEHFLYPSHMDYYVIAVHSDFNDVDIFTIKSMDHKVSASYKKIKDNTYLTTLLNDEMEHYEWPLVTASVVQMISADFVSAIINALEALKTNKKGKETGGISERSTSILYFDGAGFYTIPSQGNDVRQRQHMDSVIRQSSVYLNLQRTIAQDSL